ncbi:wall-associated receptor kinase 2-like protein [Tanacetum coccineum]|uniref:Wall-associated receptor kinase 2-like protein n=1 Tax=Tanacetum coccineum TaxID=301880 RepID=A0ABQ5C1H6_9ASTR
MITFVILSRTISSQSLPGCPDKCENVTIHYPFGTKKGCYLSELYHVNCSRLQVFNTSFKLLDISLDGRMHGSLPMTQRCYHKNATKARDTKIWLSRFPISSSENFLTTIGCDARANMKATYGEDYITGCLSMTGCNMLRDGLCLGMGCSQVPVPYKVTSFRIHTQRNTNVTVGKWSFNNCTYGFLVKKGHYTFQVTDFDNLQNRTFPVVFEWSVGNTSCEEARKDGENYVCGENSVCVDTLTEYNQSYQGYRCRCAQGYHGNPYIRNGCQDIDECERPDKNDCVYGCTNTKGSYECSCFWGQRGDGRKNGTGCKYSGGTIFAGISIGTGASGMLTLILYWGLRQRQIMKSREMFFKKNGGLILQKLLFESKQSSRIAKIFSARVLEKATNNFHKSNIVGQGGYGTVYKGTLPDETMVAIKKSKSIDANQIEQFINEVIILSEISHPNVVKLLGCCLETQTPLLVYEFITNKTVFQHLHEQNFISSLTFEKRLSIATQTAEALGYIHSTTQIVHRDIKTSNILLTDDYTAKVSDFGISRFIPVDETHLQTLVHGTLGYIDPEYFRSGILTEKSDVYSFGMVLVELLTGRKVYSHDGTESDLGLAMFFVSSLERGCLIQVLDDKVRKDGLDEHVKKLAKLAKDCVELEGKKRPNMKQVKEELEELCHSYTKNSIVFDKDKNFDSDQLIVSDW